jgi:isopentenyl diphosphate isomerase/L-lactate dehydrogenase-like FMN-dependent dehydrogenase
MTDDPIDPQQLRTLDQVIATARQVTESGAYTWAAAGAGQGATVDRNRLALNSLALVPRVGRDVSHVDPSSSFLSIPLAFPVMLSPIGALALYDPGDALAASTSATRMGTSAICSIHTNAVWEEVAATAPGQHFFQLYVAGDRSWLADILSRIQQARFAGVCVTLDAPVIGRRDRSLEEEFIWRTPSERTPSLRQHGWDESFRSRFTWSDLEWLCGKTELPVFVKGVMTSDDAMAATDCGVGALFVSNHGGRMVDHELSTVEVLAEIIEAVPDDVDVAVDGGFIGGAEVCKALALGAKAVGIGRLQCWGLAAGGVPGLVRVLEILHEEIALTMANIGARSVEEITPDHVRWSIPVPLSEPS